MRKFNEGGKTYDKEDEGILGGKIKYREEDGRKYVAGKSSSYDRDPAEQRYYSMDDVKGKLSGLFGGKSDSSSKYDDSKSVGDANKSSSYSKSEEGPRRQMTDSMTNKPEPAGKTYLREEADIDYKPAKQAAPRKAAPKESKIEAAAPALKKAKVEAAKKPTPLPGKADDKVKKVTTLPGKGDDNKKPLGKGATLMKEEDDKPAKYEDDKAKIGSQGGFKFDSKPVTRTRAGTIVKSSDEPSALDIAAAKQKGAEKLKKQYKDNEAAFKRIGDAFSSKSPNRSYKSGGSVRSASSRADGCAIRGKTRA